MKEQEKEEQVKEHIYAFLKKNRIAFEVVEHPPVFTVAAAREHMSRPDAADNKNLFLRNGKRTAYYLAVVPGGKRVEVNKLRKQLGEQKLSFGEANELMQYLQTTPGSVSPLGLIFGTAESITVLVDEDLFHAKLVGFHPNDNTETLYISTRDFRRFLEMIDNTVHFLRF